MELLILGLRRSGTTVFWNTFRSDLRFVAFDEPYNTKLRRLPADHPRKVWAEYIALLERDGHSFWERFETIDWIAELRPELSERQRDWLRYIASRSEHVVIDETRCNFKLHALRETLPNAVVVHLHRNPRALASSHILPNAGRCRSTVKRKLREPIFWRIRKGYDGWGFESIIGNSTSSLFAQRLKEIGLDPSEIYALPAAGRLLAFWRINVERIERDGPDAFGDRFLSVSLEDFCRNPRPIVERVYERLGLTPPELDFSGIKPANPGHAPGDQRWARLTKSVGLTQL